MNEIVESQQNIERMAAGLYDDRLAYHNFSHASAAAKRGKEIVERCHKEGIRISSEIVYYALLFHDAGYHEDSKSKGFKTKEEYAAFLAGKTLGAAGFGEELIRAVQRAIISTHRDGKFETNEEKAVRAADLSSMTADYKTFLDATRRLKLEAEMLSGQKISWAEWKIRTRKTVEFYLKQDIHLTSAHTDADGQSIFHKQAKVNLERFLGEDEAGLDVVQL